MYEIDTEGLQQFLNDGREAAKYAWTHYEELAARKHTYTLYGPYSYHIGASVPSNLTPARDRKLSTSTRRKDYHIYHLDDKYHVIRTISILNYTNIECIYQHFELNGTIYAYPFRGDKKAMFTDEVNALSFSNGKPVFFGLLSKNFVFAQFYEYIDAGKMLVSSYQYAPNAKFSQYGHPIDPNAPVGALNSSISRHCREEKTEYIDFSQWFEYPEALKVQKKQTIHPKVDICTEIGSWLDNILEQAIPPEVAAFCFNLYDDAGDKWSIELIGATHFDPENDDWACDEVTNFGTRQSPYSWEEEAEWEGILRKISRALRKYLKEGKYAEKLKSKAAVGVGFVEGDITILHHQKRGQKTAPPSPEDM